MMAGLLAVPVCVLLLVVTLALMGGRWTSPMALADADRQPEYEAESGIGYEAGYYEPMAYADPWEHHAAPEPAREPVVAPQDWEYRPALPPAREDRLALPPARSAYPPYEPEVYGAPAEPTPPQDLPYRLR